MPDVRQTVCSEIQTDSLQWLFALIDYSLFFQHQIFQYSGSRGSPHPLLTPQPPRAGGTKTSLLFFHSKNIIWRDSDRSRDEVNSGPWSGGKKKRKKLWAGVELGFSWRVCCACDDELSAACRPTASPTPVPGESRPQACRFKVQLCLDQNGKLVLHWKKKSVSILLDFTR